MCLSPLTGRAGQSRRRRTSPRGMVGPRRCSIYAAAPAAAYCGITACYELVQYNCSIHESTKPPTWWFMTRTDSTSPGCLPRQPCTQPIGPVAILSRSGLKVSLSLLRLIGVCNKHLWCGESQFFIYHTKWEAHVRMVSHAIDIDSCRDDPTRWLVYIYHTKWYPLANRAIRGGASA
eukprot:SAG25_NODE_1067_length_4136_cov_2.734209_4_plen_177_part_00